LAVSASAATMRPQATPPVATSFAQILTTSQPVSSNDDMPQPSI